jgi:hypothetical protein
MKIIFALIRASERVWNIDSDAQHYQKQHYQKQHYQKQHYQKQHLKTGLRMESQPGIQSCRMEMDRIHFLLSFS